MPVQVAPYPTVTDALVAARVLCNDAAQSILGDILASNQPFVLPMCDLAHKTLRKMLTRAGVNTYSKYGFVSNLVKVATSDPTVQVQLSYTGYFDGITERASPFLPADLVEPLEIWERQNGTINSWQPVKQASDSISTRAQVASFGIWDWESDILYLPGATQANDLKLKYLYATPRLTDSAQQIPIADCEMAMGALIAKILSQSRGGTATQTFQVWAESEVGLLISPTSRKEQYGAYNRQPFRGTRARRRR
jgi:hypothetical protein